MISMQGISSALIARNESWVRQQAGSIMRRLPSNVEKADLIQVGLIAVAQAALGFKWEGDRDSEASREAFVRYAKLRVKGAMIDELRQMDQLERSQRRRIKVIQIARERWQASHGAAPGLAELSVACGMGVDEIAKLEQAAMMVQTHSLSDDAENDDRPPTPPPATPSDEVEARVDTAIVLRRLEKLFATLPERDRQVIDAYLGIGMTPIELASALQVTPSRISQLYRLVCERIAGHLAQPEKRALDHAASAAAATLDELIERREAELAPTADAQAWGQLIERTLTAPAERFGAPDGEPPLVVKDGTRWG